MSNPTMHDPCCHDSRALQMNIKTSVDFFISEGLLNLGLLLHKWEGGCLQNPSTTNRRAQSNTGASGGVASAHADGTTLSLLRHFFNSFSIIPSHNMSRYNVIQSCAGV